MIRLSIPVKLRSLDFDGLLFSVWKVCVTRNAHCPIRCQWHADSNLIGQPLEDEMAQRKERRWKPAANDLRVVTHDCSAMKSCRVCPIRGVRPSYQWPTSPPCPRALEFPAFSSFSFFHSLLYFHSFCNLLHSICLALPRMRVLAWPLRIKVPGLPSLRYVKPRGWNDGIVSRLIAIIVDSIIQWRPLFYDSSPFHPGHHFPHRVLCLLDWTPIYIRCASFGTRPCKASSAGLKMVLDHTEVIIQQ